MEDVVLHYWENLSAAGKLQDGAWLGADSTLVFCGPTYQRNICLYLFHSLLHSHYLPGTQHFSVASPHASRPHRLRQHAPVDDGGVDYQWYIHNRHHHRHTLLLCLTVTEDIHLYLYLHDPSHAGDTRRTGT